MGCGASTPTAHVTQQSEANGAGSAQTDGQARPAGEPKPSPKSIAKLAAFEFSIAGATPEAVATKIADPRTWVGLMGMPDETVPEMLNSGSDFKCARGDGKTCYMTSVVSKDDEVEGSKMFSYTTSLTHTHLSDAGLAAPIFTVKHVFTMSPAPDGCAVQRVCTDFVQNEMLQVDLGSMLQSGMIAKENVGLVAACQAEDATVQPTPEKSG